MLRAAAMLYAAPPTMRVTEITMLYECDMTAARRRRYAASFRYATLRFDTPPMNFIRSTEDTITRRHECYATPARTYMLDD